VFHSEEKIGFHTKGYIFNNNGANDKIYIGSSNITQGALKSNQEWNIKINLERNHPFKKEVEFEFENLWKNSVVADEPFIKSYETFYNKQREKKDRKEDFVYKTDFTPNTMQNEALGNLNRLRTQGQKKAIVIAATGSGKTILAALDVKIFNPNRVLFLVHREEILNDAKSAFMFILPNRANEMGLITGNTKDKNCNFIFSTNLTMGNSISEYPQDFFDYIIIDEAHHATSNSWIKVIEHFNPKFLLGMTATPERTDGADIYEFFDNNIALEIRLRDALEMDLVAPFHYFGISDETINYGEIKLTEIDKIARLLKINQRVDFIVEKMNFYGHDGIRRKGIGFCVNQSHAQFMADEFNKRGIKSIALNSLNTINERRDAISKLDYIGNDLAENEELEMIFTVDIFNEGIDIPNINCILMLRPTSSPIVFIQQLGRGLRKTNSKEFLTVIDFIGNHSKTFLIAIALCGARAYDKDSLREAVKTSFASIPGCSNIKLDEKSKESILRQIEETNFNTLKFLKEEYFEFKKINSNKIPSILDFQKFDGSPDPLKFIRNSKSLIEFILKVEPDCLIYSEFLLNEKILKFIRFLGSILPIKRPHEFAIMEYLLNNEVISIEKSKNVIEKYLATVNKETVLHAINNLAGNFDDLLEKKNKLKLFVFDGKIISRTPLFNSILKNSKFKKQIIEQIEYGLVRYGNEFGSADYGYPFFKLYHPYNGRDIAILCNYDKTHSSFRGSGYLQYKNERFLIIDLHKEADIHESIKYKDKFIDEETFTWQSVNNTSQNSERGKDIVSNKIRGINLHLFVRKIQVIDGETQPFIYIGKGNTRKVKGNKPITVTLSLDNKVPTLLYRELTSPI
ncbi:MAG: DUF3427 domain-containing protein, partial [Bacteroidetes bacterium]|nr:DUF3427 domain-containing protein [Bacteroidota bacterium]